MIRNKELVVMKSIALCFKPFLKREEAMIYCNLGSTQLNKKLSEWGIQKTAAGYFKKEEIDIMMAGGPALYEEKLKKMM